MVENVKPYYMSHFNEENLVYFNKCVSLEVYYNAITLKQLSSRCSNYKKWKKITVKTGQVIFSGEIYYYRVPTPQFS